MCHVFVCSLFLLDVFIDLLVPPAEASSLATSSWVFSPPSVMRVIPWGLGNVGEKPLVFLVILKELGRFAQHYSVKVSDCCEPQRFKLFFSKPCSVLIQMTAYPMPNALHPSWTDYRLLFAKSASPHHGFAAFYTYLEFIFKVPQFFSFKWLSAQHLAQDF